MDRPKLFLNLPNSPTESALFDRYLSRQAPSENYLNSDYDYLSAFRGGLTRDAGNQHFPDTYKYPFHPTFSNESQYYLEGMPATNWNGDSPVPAVNDDILQQFINDSLMKRFLIKHG